MTPKDRHTIIVYRLERADESLQAARLLRENSMLIPAMNRVYYAMFYAVQALLAHDDVAFSKHGQVKGENSETKKPVNQACSTFREVVSIAFFPL